jgi:predicted nucleic acid-binding protein
VAYLFDTDAISEVLKPKPLAEYVRWLERIPRADQFTSAVVVGELFKGAFRSPNAARHIRNIESRVLPALSVIPYDLDTARVYGAIQANLEDAGRVLADADLQIGATALHHDLELVTGNLRHFRRIPGLRICTALAEARTRQQQGSPIAELHGTRVRGRMTMRLPSRAKATTAAKTRISGKWRIAEMDRGSPSSCRGRRPP